MLNVLLQDIHAYAEPTVTEVGQKALDTASRRYALRPSCAIVFQLVNRCLQLSAFVAAKGCDEVE